VACYDLEVQIEDGEWQRLLTRTQSTNYEFTLPTGSYFTFRVTATDNVGNQASAETSSHVARVTKYYYHGGRRVAMRAGGVVYYLHGDHLGSTSLVTSQTAEVVSRQLYHPYGTVRHSAGTLPTDFGFTGQRHDGSTGLIFMHARYYHAGLGRFTQADTIVPQAGNPQDFNRYAYVRNNPIRYSDPTGHAADPGGGGGVPWPPPPPPQVFIGMWPAPPRDPRALDSGTLTGRVFIGEPPWELPETAPDLSLPLGWLGVAQGLLDLFYTFTEPYAAKSYIETQEPNVNVHLTYSYYEEGLRLWEVVVDNEAGTPLKTGWDINFGRGVECRDEPAWATGGGINESLHMEMSPDGSVFISPRSGLISPVVSSDVTVHMWALWLDPAQYRTVVFVLPGRETANYTPPYVK